LTQPQDRHTGRLVWPVGERPGPRCRLLAGPLTVWPDRRHRRRGRRRRRRRRRCVVVCPPERLSAADRVATRWAAASFATAARSGRLGAAEEGRPPPTWPSWPHHDGACRPSRVDWQPPRWSHAAALAGSFSWRGLRMPAGPPCKGVFLSAAHGQGAALERTEESQEPSLVGGGTSPQGQVGITVQVQVGKKIASDEPPTCLAKVALLDLKAAAALHKLYQSPANPVRAWEAVTATRGGSDNLRSRLARRHADLLQDRRIRGPSSSLPPHGRPPTTPSSYTPVRT